jgi:KDO2-lipid IV(A) lauroyltransferase
MRQRSAIRNGIEYALAWMAIQTLKLAPLPLARRLARFYARVLDRAVPRLREVAQQNLDLALPHEDPTPIIDGVFDSIGRLLLAFARLPKIGKHNLHEWIRCEGMEYVDAARRAGRGTLFATAHLGNWELSAYAHAMLQAPMHVVVRPLDNPLIDRMVERRRTGSGNRVIAKKDSARAILKALAANEAVGLLIDQNSAPESGVFVNFFGVPACAGTGFAKIAAHSGAAVIPGFALWSEKEQRYILRFYPPVPMTGNAKVDTEVLQGRLEEVIREHPDQWLWIHRRWKTRPPGSRPLYGRLREVR